MISVLSVGLVAGPASPTLRVRLDVSISCGAKRRVGRLSNWRGTGEGDRGEASGVSSAVGPMRGRLDGPVFFRTDWNVVSIGTGANRRRGWVLVAMIGGRREVKRGLNQGSSDLLLADVHSHRVRPGKGSRASRRASEAGSVGIVGRIKPSGRWSRVAIPRREDPRLNGTRRRGREMVEAVDEEYLQ